METHTLQAEVRETRGKGPARQLRAKGLIPAIFYGAKVEPRKLAVSPKELTKILTTERGRNSVIKLKIGNDEELALVRDLQVDPVKRDLVHADLYRIYEDVPVRVLVPFRTRGRAAGVVKGGEMRVVFRTIPVKAKPGDIPAKIEVDVSALELNEVIQVKDLQLPEGVVVQLNDQRTLVAIQSERRRAETTEEAAAPEAAAAGEPAAG